MSLDKDYRERKGKLCTDENTLKDVKRQMFKLTQETGIVKNKFLKHDFINRKRHIESLDQEKALLEVALSGKTARHATQSDKISNIPYIKR